ncbi:DUF2079 domain-containing protein [Dactylosporangium sp. NPDC048998]|uniref:DUF2079 domain-containing protein n=1 Tax=Dactylosporangium sp. NPDC048998 TaxID=3363976 RepID=UPI003715D22B
MSITTAEAPARADSIGSFDRRRTLPYVLAVALFAAYTTLSVSRHLRIQTAGYDLGIFEQAVRAYAHLQAPVSQLKGPGYHLLGDHFHPLLMLLAPAYRIFPSPITLLVVQALLLAVSAVPVTRYAMRVTGTAGGLGIGVAYGLSWGLQQAVAFDFHEVCLAVPLFACALVRLAEHRWHAAVLWALPLVLVKEDLPATVAALGGYLILRRQYKLGLAVVAFAVVTGLVITGLVIPAFNPQHAYPYETGASAEDPLTRLLTPGVKLSTTLWLLLPTLFLAVRSPLLLLAAPTLAWRFWSTNHMYWGTEFQYSAILMPVIFVALLHALTALRTHPNATVRWWTRTVPAFTVVVALACTTALPLRRLVFPSTWKSDPAAAATRATLETIPDGAVVAATNLLAAQLTARCTVYLYPNYPDRVLRPEWVAVTDFTDPALIPLDQRAAFAALPDRGYELVTRQGGVAIYHRRTGHDGRGAER